MKLKDYWPRCLQDLVEFQQIANAEQPEFETALDDVRTAADDFFLATLSEYGCQRWEAIMGLHAADGDTLEARRERILIKYLDQLPYAKPLEYGFRGHFVPGHWDGKSFVYQPKDPQGGMFVHSLIPGHYTLERAVNATKRTQNARLQRRFEQELKKRGYMKYFK